MSHKTKNSGVTIGLKSNRSNVPTDDTTKQDDLSVISVPERNKSKAPTVRYITEDLIKRLSHEDRLEIITSLNLNLGKESGRFKYIENLEPLKRLQVLNLCGNSIEKIEKLDKLTNLKELNLSDNCLTKIENLESLLGLQVLKLAGNQIQHIPMWLTKKLKALQVFGIERNQIQSIDEICKLQPLSNLVHLSVVGNPFSKIPHYRLLIVFRLRTLQMLDNGEVSLQERCEAKERFEQEELERLCNQLEKLESEKTQLVSENDQYFKNEQKLDNHLRLLEEEKQSFAQQLQEKEQELEMAIQLLQKKTNELIRTNKKQFGLEQELAFYKLDHKFDTLSRPYIDDTAESMSAEESSAESPYIGKAMYRTNRIAKEEFINAVPLQLQVRQSDSWVKDVKHIGSQLATMDKNYAEQFSQVLETEKFTELSVELEKKQNLIREAEVRLKQLQLEIEKQERYLITEPQGENSIVASGSQSEKSPKFTLEVNQASKMNQSTLRNETKLKRKQTDMVDLNYENLKDKLIQKFASMKQEIERIGSLNSADGHMVHNEELEEELESIIHNIDSHIHGIHKTADVQSLEMKELLKNNAELGRESNRLMQECEQIQKKSNAENDRLKQELADYKKSLLEQRDINESLQKHLRTNQMNVPLEYFEKIKMENEELNKTVAALEAQMEEERMHFDKKQHSNKRQINGMKKEILIGRQMDNENQSLCRQLGELQNANIHLQDQLYAAQQQLQHQKQKMVSPEALRKRLEEVARTIGTPKQGVRSVRENGNDAVQERHLQSNTLVEEAIGVLEEEISQKLEAKSTDLEKAQQAIKRMASKLQQMEDKTTQVRMQERSKAEQVIEAMARKARIEKDNLLAEINRLEDAMLQRDREQKGQHLKPSDAEISNTAAASKSITESATATTRSSTESGTYTSSSTTSSSASSQWSVRKQDLYNAMNMEEKALFDELQKQIEELRSLLAAKDKESVSMVHTAQQTFNKLNDMIDQRYTYDGILTESYNGSTGYSSSSMASESKYYDDPQLKETVEELRKAHSEMESLKDRLIVQDHKKSPPHALHEDERSLIYAILDEQQTEIDHLSQAITRDARNKGSAILGRSGATVPATVDNRQPLQPIARYGQEYSGADILSESNSFHDKSRLREPNFLKDDKTKTREFVSEYEKVQTPLHGGFPHDGAAFLHQPSRSMHYQPQRSFPRYSADAIAANNQNLAVDSNLPPNLTYRLGEPLPGLASYTGNHIESLRTMELPVMKQTIPTQGVTYSTGPAVPMPLATTADSGLNQNFRFPIDPNVAKDQPLMNTLLTQTNNIVDLPQTADQNAGRNDACHLYCNISKHHDLEDYVSKLQQKIGYLNGQLNNTTAEVIRNGTRHVPLKDASKMTQSWVHRLLSELKKRRIELEGLDLAIEREKFNLEGMKQFEVSLLSKHETISKELEALNQRKKDRSYLQTIGPLYDPENSEFNFDTTYYWSKKHYIIDELICTEETLVNRKRQLAETEQDLTELNKALINTQSELNSVEIECLASAESLKEMEQSAHDKTILLLDIEFKISETQEELENLEQSKKQSQKMLDDMENVIRVKDEEFQILRLQIEQAAKRLLFID